MDLITQTEKKHPNIYYLPFVIEKSFPGLDREYKDGVTVIEVQHQPQNVSKFVQSIRGQHNDSKQLNESIDKLYSQYQQSKCFQSLSLRIDKILDESQGKKIEVHHYPVYKPYIPNAEDMWVKQGYHLHMSLPNLFGYGEKLDLGLCLTNRYTMFLHKFRVPYGDGSVKLRFEQPIRDRSNKQVKLGYTEQISNLQRWESFGIYREKTKDGLLSSSLGLGFMHRIKKRSNLIENGLTLSFDPEQNLLDLGFAHHMSFYLQTETSMIKINNNIDYSSKSDIQDKEFPGYLGVQAGKFRAMLNATMFFKPSRLAGNYQLFPFVSNTVGYCGGANPWKYNLGVGFQRLFGRSQVKVQYNLLNYHNSRDQVRGWQILIEQQ